MRPQAIQGEGFAPRSLCEIASVSDAGGTVSSEDGSVGLMMRGMTAKNFDPVRYSGRWFEVASLKRGFAGQGQEDCHCTQVNPRSEDVEQLFQDLHASSLAHISFITPTRWFFSQGVYTFDAKSRSIQVDTFCVHGGPDGYITGIRGRVQCLSEDEDMLKAETELERREMIREKCFLRFPTLPFIPKEPYDVIATDYDTFALVSGAKDTSFVQIYSRSPNPGQEFIQKYKTYLAEYGYDAKKIKETPQDCDPVSSSQLAGLMMSMPGMDAALTNRFPDLQLNAPIALDPFTSIFDTLKKLVELYFNR